jgi:hypothetical protein
MVQALKTLPDKPKAQHHKGTSSSCYKMKEKGWRKDSISSSNAMENK